MKNKPSKDAIERMRKTIKSYREDATFDEDPEMRALFDCDADDLERVLEFYKEGEWKKAYKHARQMDTAPRENIDEEIYEQISNS